MENDDIIYGRRPVIEALKSGKPVDRVILRVGSGGESMKEILDLARSRGCRVDRLPPDLFDRKLGRKKAAGGVALIMAAVKTVFLEDFTAIFEKSGKSPFIVILEGIEDPHNLGAIARSAEGAGCSGMIVARRRAAPLSSTAMKSSAGALVHLPVVKATNISSTIEYLKKMSVWIYGADMEGVDYRKVDYPRNIALVIGGEGKGISRLVKQKCDQLISIPLRGKVESLNASVSAGILLFHIASSREI